MGTSFTKAFKGIIGSQKKRILVVGLDAAGKTTFLYKLKLDYTDTYPPIIGWNVENVEYKNLIFTAWDMNGNDKRRPLWRHYYYDAAAVIFVIDSNDRERIDGEDDTSAQEELQKLMKEEELRDTCLLLFANKQDLPNAMGMMEILDRLNVESISQDWFMHTSCATTGDGLYEGLQWLSQKLAPKKKTQCSPEYESEIGGDAPDAKWIDKKMYLIILKIRKKSILFVSGWLRKENRCYKLKLHANVSQLIHLFYVDGNIKYDDYSYYSY